MNSREMVEKFKSAVKSDRSMSEMIDSIHPLPNGLIYRFDGFLVCKIAFENGKFIDIVDGHPTSVEHSSLDGLIEFIRAQSNND